MNWMFALQALLGLSVLIIGFLVKDKLQSLVNAIEHTKLSTKERIEKENATLRHSIDEVERVAMARDEQIRKDVADLEKSLPRDYLMRQEFERRWETMSETLRDVKKGVDKINERLAARGE